MTWNFKGGQEMILLAASLLIAQIAGDEAATAAVEAANAAALSAPKVDCVGQATQLDMNVCSFQDFQAADAALNALWKQVVMKAKEADRWAIGHNFPSGEHTRLLEAQRAWLKFRDAECLYQVGPQEGGGTIWPLTHNGCLQKLTETRIDQLRAVLEPVQ